MIFSQIEIDIEVIAVEYKEGQNWGQRKGQWNDEVLCDKEGCVAYDIPMGMATDSNWLSCILFLHSCNEDVLLTFIDSKIVTLLHKKISRAI